VNLLVTLKRVYNIVVSIGNELLVTCYHSPAIIRYHKSYCLIVCLVLMTRSSSLLSKFKVFGSLEAQLLLGLAFLTFQTKHNFTGSLGLFVENGLGLSTKTHLLGVVTSLSLGKVRGLSGLVLGDLVDCVLLALAGTVSFAFFWDVHHDGILQLLKFI